MHEDKSLDVFYFSSLIYVAYRKCLIVKQNRSELCFTCTFPFNPTKILDHPRSGAYNIIFEVLSADELMQCLERHRFELRKQLLGQYATIPN